MSFYRLCFNGPEGCLLNLIKKNCSQNTFLRTLILINPVTLYLLHLLEIIWNCITVPELPRWTDGHNEAWFVKGIWSSLHLKLCYWVWTFIQSSWTFHNICVKDSCFPNCWKVSSVVPVFTNFNERSAAENCQIN